MHVGISARKVMADYFGTVHTVCVEMNLQTMIRNIDRISLSGRFSSEELGRKQMCIQKLCLLTNYR